MRIYTLTNSQTGEVKNFIKKNRIAKEIGVNTDRIELAIAYNKPINKRTGEEYFVEYRDVNIGVKLEDY